MFLVLLAIAVVSPTDGLRDKDAVAELQSNVDSSTGLCRKKKGQNAVYVDAWGRQHSALVQAVSTWPGCTYTVVLCDESTQQAGYDAACGSGSRRNCISDGNAEGNPIDELPKEEGGLIYEDAQGLQWMAEITQPGHWPQCNYAVKLCDGKNVTASLMCQFGEACLRPFDSSKVPKQPYYGRGDRVDIEIQPYIKQKGIVTGKDAICGLAIQTCTRWIRLGNWALSQQPALDRGNPFDPGLGCCTRKEGVITARCRAPYALRTRGEPAEPLAIHSKYHYRELRREVPYCGATIKIHQKIPCVYRVKFFDDYEVDSDEVSDISYDYDSASARNSAFLHSLEQNPEVRRNLKSMGIDCEQRDCADSLVWNIPRIGLYEDA